MTEHVVALLDSQIDVKQHGFEAKLLMEYCAGGNAVDLLNHLLQIGRLLTENEILALFHQVCQAVAVCHYQQPPIIHRDVKLENILLTEKSVANQVYKLCDFGSTTTLRVRRGTLWSTRDLNKMEDEINAVTTIQYRAPEMIDLYQKKGLDEKVDIWALGILLYKLCFYQTPFDDGNKLAILNCSYSLPPMDHTLPNGHPMPRYSSEMISLIRSMLVENPKERPNIYTVLENVSLLLGRHCPILNIYPTGTASYFDLTPSNDAAVDKPSAPPPKPPRARPPVVSELLSESILSESMLDPSVRRSRPVPKMALKPIDFSSLSLNSIDKEANLIDLDVAPMQTPPLNAPPPLSAPSPVNVQDFGAFGTQSPKKPPPVPPKPVALQMAPPLPSRTQVAGGQDAEPTAGQEDEDPFAALRAKEPRKPLFSEVDEFDSNVQLDTDLPIDWTNAEQEVDWDAFSIKPK